LGGEKTDKNLELQTKSDTETQLPLNIADHCFRSRTAPVVIPAFRRAMDDCTHQPMPNPEPASPAPAPPQEATGNSESDTPVPGLSLTVGDRPLVAAGYAEDDADNNRVPAASVDGDDGRGADDVAVEGDQSEVDSRMCVPWWRWTVQDAADGPRATGSSGRLALRVDTS